MTGEPNTTTPWPEEAEELLRRGGVDIAHLAFGRRMKLRAMSAVVQTSRGPMMRFDLNDPGVNADRIGATMETTSALLDELGQTINKSRETFRGLADEIQDMANVVGPLLIQQIRELRTSRMSIVAEARDSLAALRDIRKFFLEADYETEMTRLERLVRVCRELQALKADGVLDALCDSALRLAVAGSAPGFPVTNNTKPGE